MKYKINLTILVTIITVICTSCAGDQDSREEIFESSVVESYETITVTDNISYKPGESDKFVLDLALPEAGEDEEPHPAIVLIHGGGWRFGSKQERVFRSLLMDYANQGYVTLSVDYRFDQEAPFPACVKDVKYAVKWLKAHAKELNVDPDRIGSYGHSAGAHLALMLAVSAENEALEGECPWNDYSSQITSVVGGATPTEPSPQLEDWNNPDWWPYGYISSDVPPMLLLQGTDDPIVKANLVDDYVDKLKEVGAGDVNYIKVEGGGHDVSYSENLDVTRPAMDDFFERTLKQSSE